MEALLDVLAACARRCPVSIVEALTWPLLASIVAEDEHRPGWLPQDPLYVLICGLLAVGLLDAPSAQDEHDEAHRRLMVLRLTTGHFSEYLVQALEAAVQECEWPAGSGAFYSATQLGEAVSALANHGCR